MKATLVIGPASNQKMKIVFVDSTLTTPPAGGAHTFLVSASRAFVQRGHQVSIITTKGADYSMVESLRKAQAEVLDDLWLATDLPDTRAEKLAKWVNHRSPDVYIVSISPDCGWLALPLLKLNIATVSIAHNDCAAFYEPVDHYGSLLDCAVGVSAEIQRRLIADCGMPAERVREVPYGIEPFTEKEFELLRHHRAAGGPLRLGYVGRLEQPQKRVMDFVPLVVELKRRGIEFTIDFIGDGNDRVRLQEALQKQSPEAPVKFWGWLSADEVRKRFAELDLFVLMSEFEGLPVALLEAMGSGVAPVVSRIASGNTEVISDGENGFVAAPEDIAAFAARIEDLARDSELLKSMATNAWKTSLDYSVARMADRYLDLFQHLTDASFSREHRRAAPSPYPIMQSCVSPYPKWIRRLKLRLVTAVAGTPR